MSSLNFLFSNKTQFLVLAIVIGGIILSNTFSYAALGIETHALLGIFFSNLVIIPLQVAGVYYLGVFFQRKFPGNKNLYRRLAYGFTFNIPYFYLLLLVLHGLTHYYLGHQVRISTQAWILYIAETIGLTMMFQFISEAFYYIRQWMDAQKKWEVLQSVNLQIQMQGLQQQLSPHFLFNSLNSLSSLIITDGPRAEKFILELSRLYRYLLKNNEEELVSLKTEIDFAKSYIHLVKTRLHDMLIINMDLDDAWMETVMIPPLTIQLLIENAIKHNEASASQPLVIDISAEGNDALLVINQLAPKLNPVESERIGLANIFTKFKLLGLRDLEIEQTSDEFRVKVPLTFMKGKVLKK